MYFRLHRSFVLALISILLIYSAPLRADIGAAQDAFGRGDYKTAFEVLKPLAKQGDVKSQVHLSQLYFKGQGVAKNDDKAFYWAKKAADQGMTIAQFIIGQMYYAGLGVNQNRDLAIRWLKTAADKGFPKARKTLKQILKNPDFKLPKNAIENGEHAPAPFSLTTELEKLRKKAMAGDVKSAFLLGGLFYNNQLMPRDNTEAKKWFQMAADKNDAGGQFFMGVLYSKGHGVEKNLKAAKTWFQKSSDQGLAIAQYRLGLSYYNGLGVTRDQDLAIQYFKKSANQGNTNAQVMLNQIGVAANDNQAPVQNNKNTLNIEQIKQAALSGDAEAQLELAFKYRIGGGVPQNDVLSFEWTEKAALQKLPAAQFILGTLYMQGRGVARDQSKAFLNLRASADQGFTEAGQMIQKLLIYQTANKSNAGRPTNFQQFQKSALTGAAKTQYSIGIIYANGWGVARDYRTAANWYRRALNQNFAAAALQLGLMYGRGQGVEKNISRSINLFKKSAQLGNAKAKSILKQINP